MQEWDAFLLSLKKSLPITFRINGRGKFADRLQVGWWQYAGVGSCWPECAWGGAFAHDEQWTQVQRAAAERSGAPLSSCAQRCIQRVHACGVMPRLQAQMEGSFMRSFTEETVVVSAGSSKCAVCARQGSRPVDRRRGCGGAGRAGRGASLLRATPLPA